MEVKKVGGEFVVTTNTVFPEMFSLLSSLIFLILLSIPKIFETIEEFLVSSSSFSSLLAPYLYGIRLFALCLFLFSLYRISYQKGIIIIRAPPPTYPYTPPANSTFRPLPYYGHGWYRVCCSNELPAGAVKTLHMIGRDIVFFRSPSGSVHGLDAFCSHQGAHLGMGTVTPNGSLRCHFHGWTFSGDGKCGQKESNIAPECRHLPRDIRRYHTIDLRENVWVWYDGDDHKDLLNTPEPPEDRLLPPLPRDDLRYIGYTQFYMRCHNLDVAENVVDFSHFFYVHSQHKRTTGVLCFDYQPSQVVVKDHHLTSVQEGYIKFFSWRLFHFNIEQVLHGITAGRISLFDGIVSASVSAVPIQGTDVQFTVDFFMPWWIPTIVAKCVFLFLALGIPVDDVPIWNSKRHVPEPIVTQHEREGVLQFRDYCKRYLVEPRLRKVALDPSICDW